MANKYPRTCRAYSNREKIEMVYQFASSLGLSVTKKPDGLIIKPKQSEFNENDLLFFDPYESAMTRLEQDDLIKLTGYYYQ